MRLRWLWGDYVEPKIPLEPGDRDRILARISENSGELPNFWGVIIGMTLLGGVLFKYLADPLGEWLHGPPANLERMIAHLLGVAIVGTPYALACIVALGYMYVPISRRSMGECGYRVCLKCGYDLRGAPPTKTICPECGRVQEMIEVIEHGP